MTATSPFRHRLLCTGGPALIVLAGIVFSGCTDKPIDPPTADRLRTEYTDRVTELDLDGDGRKEWRAVDGREGADLDGDGKAELIWRYTANSASFEVAQTPTFDDYSYLHGIYDSSRAPYKIAQVWEDGSGDGVVDRQLQYEYDEARDNIGIVRLSDPDGDGFFIVESKAGAPYVQEQIHEGADGTSKSLGCTERENAALARALETAIDEGGRCLTALNARVGYLFARMLAMSHINVTCEELTSRIPKAIRCGQADTRAWMCPRQLYETCNIRISVNPQGDCISEATVFHELLHYMLPEHTVANGWIGDPSDRIYSCQDACFGSMSPASAKACAGLVGGPGAPNK